MLNNNKNLEKILETKKCDEPLMLQRDKWIMLGLFHEILEEDDEIVAAVSLRKVYEQEDKTIVEANIGYYLEQDQNSNIFNIFKNAIPSREIKNETCLIYRVFYTNEDGSEDNVLFEDKDIRFIELTFESKTQKDETTTKETTQLE